MDRQGKGFFRFHQQHARAAWQRAGAVQKAWPTATGWQRIKQLCTPPVTLVYREHCLQGIQYRKQAMRADWIANLMHCFLGRAHGNHADPLICICNSVTACFHPSPTRWAWSTWLRQMASWSPSSA